MPCKPDSAAALKALKGRGKAWEVGRLPRALKGAIGVQYTYAITPLGLISIIPVEWASVKFYFIYLQVYTYMYIYML